METIDYQTIFWWILKKIKPKNHIRIWWHYWCYWKSLGESDLINFASQFSKPRCGRYWFLNDFFVGNSTQLQKLGLEGKTSWIFNVFTLWNLDISILKMWNVKNVFTFRPPTQVTILYVEVEPWPSNIIPEPLPYKGMLNKYKWGFRKGGMSFYQLYSHSNLL